MASSGGVGGRPPAREEAPKMTTGAGRSQFDTIKFKYTESNEKSVICRLPNAKEFASLEAGSPLPLIQAEESKAFDPDSVYKS